MESDFQDSKDKFQLSNQFSQEILQNSLKLIIEKTFQIKLYVDFQL